MERQLSPEDQPFRGRLRSRPDDSVPAMPRSWSGDWKRVDLLGAWQRKRAAARVLLASRAATFGGGITEIQRNVVAERVLGRSKD